ncbi:chondroitinase B-like protein [Motilibacter rhizosphaerae]|uniref:Chondroitinase B-like protein n=1 Tax=Motilibacter rhizosphaerae TaxID=598652 RepID=A0A4V2F4A5_9ACTN|nr:chondroitinase-B domain-containing protein [Motilibacter rhizosphaerae]RZS86927.1 chondroitinase B-like protein [Motilibacter rhizosphaerae]
MEGRGHRVAGAVLATVVTSAAVVTSGFVTLHSSASPRVPSPFGTRRPGAPSPGARPVAAPATTPDAAETSAPAESTSPSPAPVVKGAVPIAELQGAAVGTSVTVAAPTGASAVRWIIDGRFKEKDTAAPYAVRLALGPGRHRLEARMLRDGVRSSVRVRFHVTGTAPRRTPVPSAPAVRPVGPDPTKRLPTLPAPLQTIDVSDSDGLSVALAEAQPGDRIHLADGTYTSDQFEAAASGTAARPVVLEGSPQAVLTTGDTEHGGYALHVTGSFWRLVGFSVRNAKKGIVLDGSVGTVLDSLDVGMIGEEGVHFRSGSSLNAIVRSTVHDTGLFQARYGEGVYVGTAHSNWADVTGGQPDRTDHVLIADDTISDAAAEGIDVKEGTTGGVIRGVRFTRDGTSGQNSADSWVDVKGNGWTVTGNSGSTTLLDAFQVHQVVDGWGRGNAFRANRVTGGVPGWTVGIYPPKAGSGNRVACDDRGGRKGVSNVSCG